VGGGAGPPEATREERKIYFLVKIRQILLQIYTIMPRIFPEHSLSSISQFDGSAGMEE
jgi:hypothetical protein